MSDLQKKSLEEENQKLRSRVRWLFALVLILFGLIGLSAVFTLSQRQQAMDHRDAALKALRQAEEAAARFRE